MKIHGIQKDMFYGAKGAIFETASILRKNMTLEERLLWKQLKDRLLFNVKFRRQHPAYIFILDFYCHELKLAIEIDGEIHLKNEIKNYDIGRSAELEKLGIKVLRFTNAQVKFNMEFVINTILDEIRLLTPL